MASKMTLHDRMKQYEDVNRHYLTRRIPVIIRVDGRAFHTLTQGFKKPFDDVFLTAMDETMKYICENIQGCVFGYTQSDEITLVVTDYATPDSEAWFGYNVQKMVSVSASMATAAFNRYFAAGVTKLAAEHNGSELDAEEQAYRRSLFKAMFEAQFDARVFSLPREEVCNCLIWRQQDAIRNSILSVAQSNFADSYMHGKGCAQLVDALSEVLRIPFFN